MPTVMNTRKMLDRKTWTMVTPAPVTNAANMLLIDAGGADQGIMYYTSATAIYLYDPHEDSWVLLPSPALAGTFGAGACGRFHPMGPTGTLTSSASNNTILTTALTLLANLAPRNGNPYRIRITAGSGAGREFDIVSNTAGANSKLVISNPGNVTLDNTSQFVLLTGRYYLVSPGTLAAGCFKYWDVATATWSGNLSITGLPATLGTDARLVATPGPYSQEDRGTATGGSTTTLVDSTRNWAVNSLAGLPIRIVSGTGANLVRRIISNTATTITVSATWTAPDATSTYIIEGFDAGTSTGTNTTTTLNDTTKTWTVNQWANSQVRIVAGTGAGQVRTIASNTATALTIGTAWTATPDATSIYVLEGDDNALYLAGNAAVTMYKYSISGNTWSTLAPAAARAAAPGAGANLNWVYGVTAIDWTDPTAIKNGRYLYSFRGGASNVLDAYDIAGNTWVNGIAYGRQNETFTTGSGWAYDGQNRLYIAKENTGRFFALNLGTLALEPMSTNVYPQGTATLGDKLCLTKYQDGGTVLPILYSLRHSGTELHRCLMI